jgi:hypothetical protein
MSGLRHINFAFGPGGWTRSSWIRADGRERSALIRWEEAPVSRRVKRKPDRPVWKIAETIIEDPTDPGSEPPYHRLELAFNSLEMSATLRESLDDEVGHPGKTIGAAYRSAPRKKLRRPAERRLDDDFFQQVAFAYRQAVERGLNPNKTIADDASVPYSTAARWVAQAREKHYLGERGQGKVSV